ncbi:DNA methyltransferase [Delftia acidovorans]|uniref:DNA methyltransferase n=1 Tax=Delftia acidovorans TaxID=80866 RepID=UPI0028B260B3|nr:DNA methyltransferase [Delftia acidovorans]
MQYQLEHGDCLDVLRTLADSSVDAIVTDPPYALPGGFMGEAWDKHDGREDAGFGYWLAGFTDGEGCFRVQRHERGTHTCAFQIKLRRDDKTVLERIRRFVGYGTVRNIEGEGNSNPQAVYVVQDKEGCEILVGLFRRYPLTAKKANDFEVWSEAVWEWLDRPRGNRWHGQSDQSRAAILKARLEDVRRYTDVAWSGHRFQDWCRCWAMECLRVLKPGGHLLAFGAPRQYHRLACGIEDAGFDVRDTLGWIFSSGFPKSHNLAGDWDGWGTALKPAWESIVLARKPLTSTVAENVLAHGTGALNIDGCRVPVDASDDIHAKNPHTKGGFGHGNAAVYGDSAGAPAYNPSSGRWPANLIHGGGEPAALLGEAARYFYCAKANKRDRGAGNNHPTVKPTDLMAYLCRLVTPPGGLVLDPFMGSGSTGKACMREGFRFLGIEREAEYLAIARARIEHEARRHGALAAEPLPPETVAAAPAPPARHAQPPEPEPAQRGLF